MGSGINGDFGRKMANNNVRQPKWPSLFPLPCVTQHTRLPRYLGVVPGETWRGGAFIHNPGHGSSSLNGRRGMGTWVSTRAFTRAFSHDTDRIRGFLGTALDSFRGQGPFRLPIMYIDREEKEGGRRSSALYN